MRGERQRQSRQVQVVRLLLRGAEAGERQVAERFNSVFLDWLTHYFPGAGRQVAGRWQAGTGDQVQESAGAVGEESRQAWQQVQV